MVSSTLFPAVHILGSQNVYSRAEGIADHYWPWTVFLSPYNPLQSGLMSFSLLARHYGRSFQCSCYIHRYPRLSESRKTLWQRENILRRSLHSRYHHGHYTISQHFHRRQVPGAQKNVGLPIESIGNPNIFYGAPGRMIIPVIYFSMRQLSQ